MRKSAATSLAFFPREKSKSIPLLLDRLTDTDVEVRRAALLALGNLGKGQAGVEDAIRKFSHDPDPMTQLDALVALAGLGKVDEAGIPTLLTALGSSNEETAKAAGKALSAFGKEKPQQVLPGVMDLLNKKELPAVLNALRVLRFMKAQASDTLPAIARLYPELPERNRASVLDTLLAIDTQGDYTIPVLVQALKAKDSLDRKEALLGMMRYRQKSDLFIDSLIEALKDTNQENRLLVIAILRGLGEKGTKALPNLISLTKDRDHHVRNAAVGAIGTFRPPNQDTIQAVSRTVKDNDFRVRINSVAALRQMGTAAPEQVTPILQAALESEKNEVVLRAIKSALDTVHGRPTSSEKRPAGQSLEK